MGLPKTVTDYTRNGVYLQINKEDKPRGICPIDLWQGKGNDQSPLMGLSWRRGDDKYRAVVCVKNPIRPLKGLMSTVFPKGEIAFVTRDQALVIICTMMKYLETTR